MYIYIYTHVSFKNTYVHTYIHTYMEVYTNIHIHLIFQINYAFQNIEANKMALSCHFQVIK